MIKMALLSVVNETWIFSGHIFKKYMKMCTVGAKSFHVDRHDEASSHFSQFCESA
jgi:hypothetical protein